MITRVRYHGYLTQIMSDAIGKNILHVWGGALICKVVIADLSRSREFVGWGRGERGREALEPVDRRDKKKKTKI